MYIGGSLTKCKSEILAMYNHQYNYILKVLEDKAVYLGSVTGTMPYYTTPISIHRRFSLQRILIDFNRGKIDQSTYDGDKKTVS